MIGQAMYQAMADVAMQELQLQEALSNVRNIHQGLVTLSSAATISHILLRIF